MSDASATRAMAARPDRAAITVIGAGVAGLCVARVLQSEGASVTLIDVAEGPGAHACSWWAGGMLAPRCERESAEAAVEALGARAADWWAGEGIPVTRAGTLVVATGRDRSELARFARRTSGHRVLDADGIAALEPDLAGRFAQALFFEEEAHLDPRAAITGLLERLRLDGAEIRFGQPAPAASPGAGQRDGGPVVDCRGLAASSDLPGLRGVKGEMVVLRTDEVRLSRPVRLLHPRHPLYIVPRGDGRFMLGATMIESGERGRVTARALLELLGAAYALHPAFAEAEVVEIGVDARPAFADNLPRIVRRGRRVHVNGLFRHGFLLGPAMAEEAARAALDPNHRSEWVHDDPA